MLNELELQAKIQIAVELLAATRFHATAEDGQKAMVLVVEVLGQLVLDVHRLSTAAQFIAEKMPRPEDLCGFRK